MIALNSADAATECRSDIVTSSRVTATLQPDGFVTFGSSDGKVTGGLSQLGICLPFDGRCWSCSWHGRPWAMTYGVDAPVAKECLKDGGIPLRATQEQQASLLAVRQPVSGRDGQAARPYSYAHDPVLATARALAAAVGVVGV